MKPIKFLFVCIHNSARSQMAEAFMNHYGKGKVIAESAGLEPGTLNARVVQVMHEIGIDISGNSTKNLDEKLRSEASFDYVVTVCDEASAERCPDFLGNAQKLHWDFPDPSAFVGTEEEKLRRTRQVRDEIKEKAVAWLKKTFP